MMERCGIFSQKTVVRTGYCSTVRVPLIEPEDELKEIYLGIYLFIYFFFIKIG